MKLIPSKDYSIEPRGAIGKQSCGIIFWQKTGFLRYCNQIGFNSIITLIDKKFKPTMIDRRSDHTYITFDNDDTKVIYIRLKQDSKGKKFIYGESHTAYTDANFHLKVLDIVGFISKHIGSSFFVDDATNYLEHKDYNRLVTYIEEYQICDN